MLDLHCFKVVPDEKYCFSECIDNFAVKLGSFDEAVLNW